MIRHGLAALLVLTSATVARAAEPDLPPSDPPEALEPLLPPDDPDSAPPPPIVQSEDDAQSKALDALFAQLAKADDPQFAKRIASAVQALWQRSGSDTIDLLMARSTEAQRKSKIGIAIRLMDEVVSLRPDY
ncbi:MAG TPA: tetratricopeptide repeat protein, partial [Hansschlegelia sp.]